jgi:type II secretory pathway pseudopilin PulG
MARSRSRAFTLVELLILVAAALVVAGLSVPVLRGIVVASNSESAIATLARVRDALRLHRQAGLSLRPSGHPRFGTMSELLTLGPSPALALEEAQVRIAARGAVLLHHGYLFQAYFSTRSADLTPDPSDPSALEGPDSKDAFVVYAWPFVHGRSGSSVFAIDPSGRLRDPAFDGVLESRNLLARYSGLERPPAPFAARVRAGKAPRTPQDAAPGEDGDSWAPVPMP